MASKVVGGFWCGIGDLYLNLGLTSPWNRLRPLWTIAQHILIVGMDMI